MRARAMWVAVLVAVLAMTTACVHATAPPSPPPSASARQPEPAGLSTTATPEPLSTDEGCGDATASLTPGPMPEVNRMPPNTTMASIAARGRLIVGLDVGSNPFSFRDPISGTIQGFDVDIAKEVARAIFGDPERVEYRILNPGERISSLQNRDVDIVVKTLSITCDRVQKIAFSTVYYEASQRILALRTSDIQGIGDLAGKRVCAARGSTSIARLQQQAPAAHVETVSTEADCLVVLQQGQVDAVSTDDAILAGLAAQDPYAHVVGASMGSEPYGIGVNKDQTDLVRFVNGVLQTIRANGRWLEIYNRWLSILGPVYYPPQPSYRD
ncbi:glutamate ABC transporter substrate-binding protein [Williamsia sterculiae]|uniref:Amino acid ABC transporter substrate-binding protein, PAAT family n=1 Tax=Williamsia sterculiae TaxID=1344003 RepID=A0A1N7F1M6_9NOCA|nr:glutamate ABC transporter substrate-binding protein [Williamsia sterculiae]SIR94194.1 amino acid ABC transporter substrate-binding protein, PAAT family [Williamsia sterculiae]